MYVSLVLGGATLVQTIDQRPYMVFLKPFNDIITLAGWVRGVGATGMACACEGMHLEWLAERVQL